ncbi:MAG TPA: FAD-dependent oxidoreductase [Candidatus Eisenbacteria bacterium]|nr:FAD-dependent oxidoreductase [Candidatus Eisenbacteria bacterium]
MAPRTIVIGAGFAGLSTAYHLALGSRDPRSVLLLERDPAPALHASGRNAGMIRQAVADPALARLAGEGRRLLEKAARSWKGLSLAPTGSIFLSDSAGAGLKELRGIERTARLTGLRVQRLSRRQAERRVPLLEGARFEEALLCPSDAQVDIAALAAGFRRELTRLGVRMSFNRRIERIRPARDGFEVRAGGETFGAGRLVNAAGAWAGEVARLAGATRVPLTAYRRHLYFGRVKPFDKKWPFVWDISRGLYFRPYGGRLLASPCDKEPFALSDRRRAARAESPDPRVERSLEGKIRGFGGGIAGFRIEERKAALRTMTPDGRFVVGEDAKLGNFFWVAALGGHGVTTSFSTGRLAAGIVLGRRQDPFLVKAFSPARFLRSRR